MWRGILEVIYRCWLILGQGALVACGYGQWVALTLGPLRVPLLEKIVVLAPFVVAVILGWIIDYRFHLAVRSAMAPRQAETTPYWSRTKHVLYNIRHLLLFVAAPVGLILLVIDLLELYILYWVPPSAQMAVHVSVSLTAAAAVFLFAPLLIVRIWRTRRLEDGQLRSDLEDMCSHLKLRYRDILVWESDGVIANAAVMGLIPPARFILVSDGVLDRMDGAHIRAIFAHEGGHITSRHLPYMMLLAVAGMSLCGSATDFLAISLGLGNLPAMLVMLSLVGLVGGVVFGAVSRRFERQSDIIGAWAAVPPEDGSPRITQEGAVIFANSLERIAQMNGIDPHRRNWRHGSIASRIEHILFLGSTGGGRTAIDATVRRIKTAILLAVVAASGLIALQIYLIAD